MANGKDDIRVALGWPRHFKRRALQNELGAAGPLALIDLWCFAGEHRPDGVFKSREEVEIAVDWPRRQRGRLVAALIATGWLEPDGVTLHDWAAEQPWISNRPARLAAARAAGAEGGRKSAEARAEAGYGPRGTDGKFTRSEAEATTEAKPKRNPSGAEAPAEPPSPSPSPSPSPTPTPQPQSARATPGAAAAEASPPGATPDPLASDLAARIAWPTVATVVGMLAELRTEGFTDADLRARIDATPAGRVLPWDWAKAARKARGAAPAGLTDRDRAETRRSALRFAGYARDAEAVGDTKTARDSWNAVRLRAEQLGVDPAEFGAPPLPTDERAA